MEKDVIKQMRQAIKNSNLDIVKNLIESHEGLLEASTVFGTFLHDAATNGEFNIAKYLVECGIDVNKKGGVRQCGALTVAAFNGHYDIVKLLCSHGAELETDSFESNPLFAAIYGGYEEIARFLVENGIDITIKYKIGKLDQCDAYEYARQYGRTEIAEFLRGERT